MVRSLQAQSKDHGPEYGSPSSATRDKGHGHGLLEEALALGAGLPGEPYSGADDGDGEEVVENAYQVVGDLEHVPLNF